MDVDRARQWLSAAIEDSQNGIWVRNGLVRRA